MGSIFVLSLLSALQSWSEDGDSMNSFNVLDYGAIGDGTIDDTLAFEMTWERTCNAVTSNAEMIVPKGMTFLLYPMVFDGPCNPTNINFLISGTIIAPDSSDAWEGRDQGRWLIFDSVNGLNVNGGGLIDGRGQGWWDISCKILHQAPGCVKLAPTVLSFLECNKVSMRKISIVNSPQTHILITGSNSFTIDSLSIKSPGSSPNTDGIHISSSHGVLITNSNIGSGDDCVSIGDHTSDIHISDVKCGPGHGVSIGSLGRSGNEVKVENISLIRGHFNQTTNGVRIKTWQVGRGHVRGVSFRNIYFTDVKNPIIIDQYYCDVRSACKPTKTGVKISDVLYSGGYGTSNSTIAINLNCSQAVPCTNIVLDNIHLVSSTRGKRVNSSCNNAYGRAMGVVKPESCLLKQC